MTIADKLNEFNAEGQEEHFKCCILFEFRLFVVNK